MTDRHLTDAELTAAARSRPGYATYPHYRPGQPERLGRLPRVPIAQRPAAPEPPPAAAEPPVLDLSQEGVDAILTALAAAGIEVHYYETDDHYIDIHLRPVDTDDALIVLSWYHDRLGWRVVEADPAGVEQHRWLIGHVDLAKVVSEAAAILGDTEPATEPVATAPASTAAPPAVALAPARVPAPWWQRRWQWAIISATGQIVTGRAWTRAGADRRSARQARRWLR